jgi:hypothetical protein
MDLILRGRSSGGWMNKDYWVFLAEEFERRIKQEYPLFTRSKSTPADPVPRGNRRYTAPWGSNGRVFLELVIHENPVSHQFTIEVGWSPDGSFPLVEHARSGFKTSTS